MSPLPSRAAALVAPLPTDGMVAAAMAPAEAVAATAALETTAVMPPVAEPAREPKATVSPAKGAAPAAGSEMPHDGAVAAAPEHPVQPAKPAPAMPVFVGKPATATTSAHVGKAAPSGSSPASAGSIGGALFALVLVVGLILALGWIARRMPGFRAGGRNSALRVVDSLTLGPRERVVVVAVGDTQLLLGVGAGGTRTLHTLTEPLPVPDTGTTPAFAQLLAQHFGKKA